MAICFSVILIHVHGILIWGTEGKLHIPFVFRDALVFVPTYSLVAPNALQSDFPITGGFFIRSFEYHSVNYSLRNTTRIVAVFRSASLPLRSILNTFNMCFVIKHRGLMSIQLFRHPVKKK